MARNNNTATRGYAVEAECVENICMISEVFLNNVKRWEKVLNSVEKTVLLYDEIMKEKMANGASANEALDSTLIEIRLVDDLSKQ